MNRIVVGVSVVVSYQKTLFSDYKNHKIYQTAELLYFPIFLCFPLIFKGLPALEVSGKPPLSFLYRFKTYLSSGLKDITMRFTFRKEGRVSSHCQREMRVLGWSWKVCFGKSVGLAFGVGNGGLGLALI